MFGILATIIAIKKDHIGYAVFTGVWTVLAIVFAIFVNPKIAVGPGVLFFCIALGLKNPEKPMKQRQAPFDEEKKYVCRNCNSYSRGWYQVCPNCGATGKMEKSGILMTQPIKEAETSSNELKWAVPDRSKDKTESNEELLKNSDVEAKNEHQPKGNEIVGLAGILEYALKYSTDSGMIAYLKRDFTDLNTEESVRLNELLADSNEASFRSRVQELLNETLSK